jgi:hypothetical protein
MRSHVSVFVLSLLFPLQALLYGWWVVAIAREYRSDFGGRPWQYRVLP